ARSAPARSSSTRAASSGPVPRSSFPSPRPWARRARGCTPDAPPRSALEGRPPAVADARPAPGHLRVRRGRAPPVQLRDRAGHERAARARGGLPVAGPPPRLDPQPRGELPARDGGARARGHPPPARARARALLREGARELGTAHAPRPRPRAGDGRPLRRGDDAASRPRRRDRAGGGRTLRAGHALRGHDRAGPRAADPAASPPLSARGARAPGRGEGDHALHPRRSHGAGRLVDAAPRVLRPDTLGALRPPLRPRRGGLMADRLALPPSSGERGASRAYAVAGFGVFLLLVGSYWGLAKAPAEVDMGDVQRIMYGHAPTAWNP